VQFGAVRLERHCGVGLDCSRRSHGIGGIRQEGMMFVSCSTLCFARMPFAKAMRRMLDLEFDRVEYAFGGDSVHEELLPSRIADSKESALREIRNTSGLNPSSFDIRFSTADLTEQKRQFEALCWLAKSMIVAVVSVEPSKGKTSLDQEADRLGELMSIASRFGVVLTVTTHSEGLTARPADAVALCRAVPELGLTLDPSHFVNGPHQSMSFDEVYPYVRNVRLRDSGRKPGEFQVKVGQGEVEYARVISQLHRGGYKRGLVLDIEDREDNAFDTEAEVRKLKLVLESLL
jgi:sugar phosphate isomerase/epimerase